MEKVSELTTEPIVGKFYLVPCINIWPGVTRGNWMPIVGPLHADPDLIPQAGTDKYAYHWHRDLRFLSKSQFRGATDFGALLYQYKWPSSYTPHTVEYRRRKCLRVMGEFPYVPEKQVWSDFHKAHIGRKVLCGKCPHKGFPLESLPKDANGHVICNGHGLKIDMNKREVINR